TTVIDAMRFNRQTTRCGATEITTPELEIATSKMSGKSSQRCILAIGQTGLGKSFTATVFGAKGVKVGHTSESETQSVTVYKIKDGIYIDTPGFDDSDVNKHDDETARSIIHVMVEAKVPQITTILWFVTPQTRALGSLQRQARFIETIAENFDKNVWDNTIIVTKGLQIGKGACEAAKKVAQTKHNTSEDLLSGVGKCKIQLFEKLDEEDKGTYGIFTSDQLKGLSVFKETELEQIRKMYEYLMNGHLQNPIPLKLNPVKCLNCLEIADPRFAGSRCHKICKVHPNTSWSHRGQFNYQHTAGKVSRHSSYFHNATTEEVTDHSVWAWTGRIVTLGIADFNKPKLVPGYWNCCRNDNPNSSGCATYYACCNRDLSATGCMKYYPECSHYDNAAPCYQTCKKCNRESEESGCTDRCKYCETYGPSNVEGCQKVGHGGVEHNFPKNVS
ncbi:9932_t:CDS:2, partial [Paraglomus brasilianum]